MVLSSTSLWRCRWSWLIAKKSEEKTLHHQHPPHKHFFVKRLTCQQWQKEENQISYNAATATSATTAAEAATSTQHCTESRYRCSSLFSVIISNNSSWWQKIYVGSGRQQQPSCPVSVCVGKWSRGRSGGGGGDGGSSSSIMVDLCAIDDDGAWRKNRSIDKFRRCHFTQRRWRERFATWLRFAGVNGGTSESLIFYLPSDYSTSLDNFFSSSSSSASIFGAVSHTLPSSSSS